MNNSEKRFVLRLMGAFAVIQHNAKKHREAWEIERNRCKKENEEFIMDKFLLGRSTFIANQMQKFGNYLDETCEGLVKDDAIINKVLDSIYETISKENNKNKGKAVCDINKMKKEEHLPIGFIDSWICVWFAFKYIVAELKKTVDKHNIDLSAVETAINQYNKFFTKEILVIEE